MKLRLDGTILAPHDFTSFEDAIGFVNYKVEYLDDEQDYEWILIDYKEGRTMTPYYKLIDGEFVEVEYCNNCNKLFPLSELTEYRHERAPELLCETHLAMLEV